MACVEHHGIDALPVADTLGVDPDVCRHVSHCEVVSDVLVV